MFWRKLLPTSFTYPEDGGSSFLQNVGIYNQSTWYHIIETEIVTHYAYMICKFLGSCSSAVYGSILLGYGIKSLGCMLPYPRRTEISR